MNDKELLKEIILEVIELVDDKIGGPIMDHPIVDKIEAKIVDILVESLWIIKVEDKDDIMPWSS